MEWTTQKGHLSRDIHKLSQYHYGSTTLGANLIPWSTKHFEFVTPTHTSNDFQSDINWLLLAADGVSNSDNLVKGDLTLVSLGNYLNPHLLTEVNSVLLHQYCHDRDSTDRDSTEF